MYKRGYDVLAVLIIYWLHDVCAQIATPVHPCYNRSLHSTFFKAPQIPNDISLIGLRDRGAVGYSNNSCLTNANAPTNSHNHLYAELNGKGEDDIRTWKQYINGTTYWINDYMHVGHVHYDIVLLQVLMTTKVDRVIFQRAVCHGTLCAGLGSMDSYYKGYYAAIFNASGQPLTPLYVRWTAYEKEVKPLFFSTNTHDYYYDKTNTIDAADRKPYRLDSWACFEKLIRRADTHYGDIPVVSAEAVQKFKKVAYGMIHTGPPLTTYFTTMDPPYVILFSHRGPRAHRRIRNHDEFLEILRSSFKPPMFDLRVLNNSDPTLDLETQIRAVAEAHVVLTNHGAFEANMIYMRNGSLLLEMFGNYGNNEVHTFHRLALTFGVYYGRMNAHNLVEHYGVLYDLSYDEIGYIVGTIKEYFKLKPFSHNVAPV